MRAWVLAASWVVLGCEGPAAPDPAICRDYIHRVCIAPVCAQVTPLVPTGQSCEAVLQTNSGCISEEFTFTTPTRDRFLSCRLALLRASANVEAHPDCDDVAESFEFCPDVVRLLKGIK